MHKLLQIQLKKSFGKAWQVSNASVELQHFIDLVEQSYKQYDGDYRLVEQILEKSSEELTQANKELRNSHDLLHSVTESISDMIFYKGLDFKYIGCNEAFGSFVGRPVDEIVGKDDFELFADQYAQLFRTMDERMLEAMAPRTNKEWVKFPDGRDAYMYTTKTPLKNSQGEVFGLVGIAHDITNEYNLEQEVRSQQAMLIQQSRFAAMGEMIGNIAHQWRQPLNALGLIVQDVEEAYEFGEVNEAYIRDMSVKAMEQINYMSRTIDDFRNFFNPHKEKRYFFIRDSVLSASGILSPGWKKYGIICTIDVPDDLVVYGFVNEFSQVLFNLLNNAKDVLIERQIKNPTIMISARREGSKIKISVIDNGEGIHESILPSIYDPYFTTKEDGKGTGIGLYMAKMIIEEHMNGTLEANNTDEGIAFTITLDATVKDREENNDI